MVGPEMVGSLQKLRAGTCSNGDDVHISILALTVSGGYFIIFLSCIHLSGDCHSLTSYEDQLTLLLQPL